MRSVYKLFRGLGLRHLIVVDHDNKVKRLPYGLSPDADS